MADDTGFFRFDTNLGQIVSEIEQGMSRIRRATTQAGPVAQQAIDIEGLSGVFAKTRDGLLGMQAEMRNLIQQVGRSEISPQQFRESARGLVQGTMVNAQQALQSEFRNIPQSTLRSLDFRQVMGNLVGDIYRTAGETLNTYRPEANGLLAGVGLRRPGKLMESLSGSPFGTGPTDPIGALKFQSFLEGLVRRDYGGYGPEVEQILSRTGLTRQYVPVARGMVERDAMGMPTGLAKTSTAADLREQIAAERAAEGANREYQRTVDQVTRSTNQASAATYSFEQRLEALRLAQRLNAGEIPGHRLPSGSFLADSGRAYVPGAGGMMVADANQAAKVRDEYDKLSASTAKLAQEEANYQRLQREGVQIGRSVNYLTPDGAILRDMGGGRARELVGTERTRAAQDYVRQLQSVEAEERRIMAAREREAHRAAANDGPLGGFLGRFHRGDQGVAASLASQVASATAFSFAYGSLFAVQHAIRDTLSEVVDYQDSLTDLEVATTSVDNVTGDWINSLSEFSRLTGENIGASLDTAARGVRAFGDAARQSKADIQDVGSATNEAATKLALIANKPLADATGDIISVGTAFGLDPDQLDQITDAVANAKRSLGGDPSQIAQGLSLVALTAEKAGYSLNEAAAVMSLVQARTDQTGQAIATRLSRIFQIVSGSTGKGLARELGVDPNQSIKKQIEDFAKLYSEGSPAVQDRISSALGGTANLRELLPLLQEQGRLQEAYASALDNAGQGTDEFNRKTQNLVGQLKQVKGVISNIQVDIARSGVFAPAGLALEVLNPALQGLDRLIRLYDEITSKVPGLQEALAITAELLLTAKAIGAVSAANAGFGLLGGAGKIGRATKGAAITGELAVAMAAEAQGVRLSAAQRIAAERTLNATIMESAGQRRVAEGAATGAAATGVGGGLVGGLKSMGRFLKSPGFLIGSAVVGGLALADYAGDRQDQAKDLARQGNDSLRSFTRTDGSSESLRRAAQDLNAAIGKLSKTDVRAGNVDQRDRDVDLLKSNQKYLAEAATRVAKEEQLAAKMRETSVFGDGLIETVGELGKGLDELSASGANAITMATEFRQALRRPADETGGVIFRPEATISRIASDLYGAIGPAVRQVAPNGLTALGGPKGTDLSVTGRPLPTDVTAAQAIELYRGEIDPAMLDFVLRQQVDALNLKRGDVLTPEQERSLIEAAARSMNFALTPEKAQELQDAAVAYALSQAETDQGLSSGTSTLLGAPLIRALRAQFAPTAQDRAGLLNGRGKLSSDQVLALFRSTQDETGAYTGIEELFNNELAAIPSSDDGTKLRQVLRTQKRFGDFLERRTEGGLPEQVADFFAETDHKLKVAVDERLEQLRKVAQSAGGLSKKEMRAIGRDFLFKRLDNAKGDTALMIQVMESANQQALDLYRQTLENALAVAKAAQAAQFEFFGALAAFAQVANAVNALAAFDKARAGAVVGVDPNAGVLGGEGAATYDPEKDAGKTAKDKAEEALQKRRDAAALTAAKAQAAASRRGGSLAEGQAQLTAAAASLRAEERGTTEWYNALASWYDARRSMQDAVLQYRYTLDQLSGDITDPVENARDELRNARRTLAAHRRAGAGKDVLAQDRLNERQSQAALEQEKFQQKLSDMQTAEELGRISFQKYVQYLEHEHDRLSAIKNRTRQQQDQLDEVDRAMQDATAEVEGMWNFGDINTRGIAYQMRRAVESQKAELQATVAAGRASRDVQTLQSITIDIDGADVAKVRKILSDLLGTRVLTTQSRRR